MIASTSNNAFQLHGLGPNYGNDLQGKVAIYIQTPGNVGPHGRGIVGTYQNQGWICTPKKLIPGQWYFIEVEKQSKCLRIACDGEVIESGLENGVTPETFVMKPTGNILIKKGTGDTLMDGEVKDFQVFQNTPKNSFLPFK